VRLEPSLDRLLSDYVSHRYQVRALLGRGGMARVYRVYDTHTSREVALKHWWISANTTQSGLATRRQSIQQFEYEYRTLAQLRHPRMIEVFDYGLSERGPYFTMELLDGGDLRERAPLPWREACRLLYDVCASLARLHSRQLIHRDVSPRNVRCTRHGAAKLIDFGAAHPMGLCPQVVGTPAFAAPEVVRGVALDARVDLYSLGGTLYFALTGRPPSDARDFADILTFSQHRPLPPSRFAADIPPALDNLVLALLDADLARRPRTAFEVMQRLSAIAHIEHCESLELVQAYLASPEFVAREDALSLVRERATLPPARERTAREANDHSDITTVWGLHHQNLRGCAILIEGERGSGRTRLLETCELWAQTLGASVLRYRSENLRPVLSVSPRGQLARVLAEQLIEALPVSHIIKLRDTSAEFEALFEPDLVHEHSVVRLRPKPLRLSNTFYARKPAPRHLRMAVVHSLLRASIDRPLVVSVDDVHMCQADDLELLAELTAQAREHRLLLLMTRKTGEGETADLSRQHVERIRLSPLHKEQTQALLRSVFGDVPNLALLSGYVHSVTVGNPSAVIALTQHLVANGSIRYESGVWTLPNQLADGELPEPLWAPVMARLARLSPLAKSLARAQVLSLRQHFTREAYNLLAAGHTERQVQVALAELVQRGVLEHTDGTYKLAHGAIRRALCQRLSAMELRQLHAKLADLCLSTGRSKLQIAHHLLCADKPNTALEHLSAALRNFVAERPIELLRAERMSAKQAACILARCLEAARAVCRPASEQLLLRRWLTLLSVLTDDAYYKSAAPEWRSELTRSVGSILRYLNRGPRATPQPSPEHLAHALIHAEADYGNTPDELRTYAPSEALAHLITYVNCSLVVGARRLDLTLLDSLPGLVAPFVQLLPELQATWQIALGVREALCQGRLEHARELFADAYLRLETASEQVMPYRDYVRGMVAYALSVTCALLGRQSAEQWSDVLHRAPLSAVNALHLQRIARMQAGDTESADHLRREAERLSLRAPGRHMFAPTLLLELTVHATRSELLGLKQLSDHIARLSEHCAAWEPYRTLALGYFEQRRGDTLLSLRAFERCLSLCDRTAAEGGYFSYAWPLASAGLAETLIERGDYQRAVELARSALLRCQVQEAMSASHLLVRALGLALAKLGKHAQAAELLSSHIERARAAQSTGIYLGFLYEAHALIATETGDVTNVLHYARLAMHEYRRSGANAIGARCEQLIAAALQSEGMNDAVDAAYETEAWQLEFDRTVPRDNGIARAMAGAELAEGRALRALRLMCESHGARAGYLLLVHGPQLNLSVSATYGASDPPTPELVSLAEQRLRAELRQCEDVTRVRGDTHLHAEAESRMLWTDQHGQAFEHHVLHCYPSGKARCAGVLLLSRERHARPAPYAAQWTSALSAYLIDSGETPGL